MSDERKRENEEEKLKDFFHNVIGNKIGSCAGGVGGELGNL